MAKKKVEEKINLDSILFKCRDILRQARNSGSFFEKRDMMLTLVFLRFIGEKFEDGIQKLRLRILRRGHRAAVRAVHLLIHDRVFDLGSAYIKNHDLHLVALP